MILQALTAYYEQLVKDGKAGLPGWDNNCKISYALVLNSKGELVKIAPCFETVISKSKEIQLPQKMEVPTHAKRSSNICPYFLCDNAIYMLGADIKNDCGRELDCFAAMKKLHHKLLKNVNTPTAKAILAYFNNWAPAKAKEHKLVAPIWDKLLLGANLTFCYTDGNKEIFAIKDEAIRKVWQKYYDAPAQNADVGICLITGKTTEIVKIHPVIKGIRGSSAFGGAIVSFANPAYCSYGHEKGLNAPIGKYAAFAYTSAINALAADRDRCRTIGDMTVLCWSDSPSASYSVLAFMGLIGTGESRVSNEDVFDALSALANGSSCAFNGDQLQAGERLYILGLSPNNSRLVIRFFLSDSFSVFAQRLLKHQEYLNIKRPAYDDRKTLPVWSLAMETVNKNAKNAAPKPQLISDILHSILAGERYPATLLNGVTIRIRTEKDITRGRAAVLKAYYLRNRLPNGKTMIPEEVLNVELNENCTYLPYQLGRLFSTLEMIQKASIKGLKTTMKDRYLSSACATPCIVFPTLINRAQNNLKKVDYGLRYYYENQLAKLLSTVGESYPARMTLEEQGAFQLGYYHQTMAYYTKKNADAEETEAT